MNTSYIHIIKGKPAIWITALLFTSVGFIFTFIIPSVYVSPIEDSTLLSAIFTITGIVFLIIGGIIFIMSLTSLYVKTRYPQKEDLFFWWINFIGGLAGALTFALPSTFIYPLYSLIPYEYRLLAKNIDIMLPIFTGIGILVDIAILYIARNQFKNKPHWK